MAKDSGEITSTTGEKLLQQCEQFSLTDVSVECLKGAVNAIIKTLNDDSALAELKLTSKLYDIAQNLHHIESDYKSKETPLGNMTMPHYHRRRIQSTIQAGLGKGV